MPPKAKAAAINRQGGTLLEQGSLEEAVTLFDQAIAIDPHLTGAMTNRGYALLRLNRLDEAETSAMQALEASSASRIRASAQVLIGKIAEARGDVRQARAHYEDALREQHGYPQAKEALAVLPLAGDDVEGRPEPPSEKEHEGTPKPVDEQTQAKPKGWVDPFGSP